MSNSSLQAISRSVTILAKPESDNPDEYRTHLPVPKVEFTKGVEQPEWKSILDERIKKKTKRFNSVSSITTPEPGVELFYLIKVRHHLIQRI